LHNLFPQKIFKNNSKNKNYKQTILEESFEYPKRSDGNMKTVFRLYLNRMHWRKGFERIYHAKGEKIFEFIKLYSLYEFVCFVALVVVV